LIYTLKNLLALRLDGRRLKIDAIIPLLPPGVLEKPLSKKLGPLPMEPYFIHYTSLVEKAKS
jgi:hypothetical protein